LCSDRCDPDDITAIANLYYLLWGQEAPEHSMCTLFFFNEAWSELWYHWTALPSGGN
jgi:hypothetical protein